VQNLFSVSRKKSFAQKKIVISLASLLLCVPLYLKIENINEPEQNLFSQSRKKIFAQKKNVISLAALCSDI